VAADSFVSTAYTGVEGGMVIVTADDPSMHSSQNEQDNRIYARLANIPMLEPATAQETKEFTRKAFEISRELGMPVILRLTTRISHTRGPVTFGELKKNKRKSVFKSNPAKYVPIPSNAYREHKELRDRIDKAKEMSDKSDMNQIYPGDGVIGIIASGVGAAYAREVRKEFGKDIPLLSLGFSYPLPEDTIIKFLSNLEKILIVEELEPVLEGEIRSLLYNNEKKPEIYGKYSGNLPRIYEYTPKIVRDALAEVLGVKIDKRITEELNEEELELPVRPPVLCAGCPHRHSYYAVLRQVKKLRKGKVKAIFTNDIGCYTLGYAAPFNTADFLLSMGSSIGTAGGFVQATDQPVISFIGDSTFFHSGMTGLVNIIHNNHNATIIILDNGTTAMTGHQPHPGIAFEDNKPPLKKVSIEKVVEGMGVEFIRVVNPNNIEETEEAIREAIKFDGPSVIISRAPCILMENRNKKSRGESIKVFKVNEDKCTACNVCVNTFACPAFYHKGDKVAVDPGLCTGCGVCTQVCPFDAFEEVKL
jgi:indolepyruvate ferredoxin oxidoreductase, alpha subunit